MSTNPYNWQSHNPAVQIPRDGVEKAAGLMLNNGSAVVIGGRGMGKSVFLHQLKTRLERDADTRVLLIEAPPPVLSIEASFGFLAESLGVDPSAFSSRRLFDQYFARDDVPKRLVLLFDEFDRYAEKGASAQPPGRGFFNDLEASRGSLPRLSILAAGSVGVFIVRDVLGSSFLARALYVPLLPFERADAEILVSPFSAADRPLPGNDVLDALFLASGGIPALLTYGLQRLWELDKEATADDVTTVYTRFEEQYREYLRDLLSALQDPRLSEAPRRVWERIQQEPGRISRAELETLLSPATGALDLSLDDALYLLQVAGAVRIDGRALRRDPVIVSPNANLLKLTRELKPHGDLKKSDHRPLPTLASASLVTEGASHAISEEARAKFERLANEWQSAIRYVSSLTQMVTYPAYQRIIGMGAEAIPLVLERLKEEPEHWFWALKSISGEDPVPEEERGDISAMSRIWLSWGRQHGYC